MSGDAPRHGQLQAHTQIRLIVASLRAGQNVVVVSSTRRFVTALETQVHAMPPAPTAT